MPRPTPGWPRCWSLGLGPGERVVITLPTGADLALALFAVARAGLDRGSDRAAPG